MRVRVRVKVRVRVRVRVWAAHRLPRRHEQVDVATGVAPAYKLSYLCGGGVVRQFARRRQALNCHASQSASQSLGKAVSWKEKALIGNSLADGRRVTAYRLPLTAYRLPLTAYLHLWACGREDQLRRRSQRLPRQCTAHADATRGRRGQACMRVRVRTHVYACA